MHNDQQTMVLQTYPSQDVFQYQFVKQDQDNKISCTTSLSGDCLQQMGQVKLSQPKSLHLHRQVSFQHQNQKIKLPHQPLLTGQTLTLHPQLQHPKFVQHSNQPSHVRGLQEELMHSVQLPQEQSKQPFVNQSLVLQPVTSSLQQTSLSAFFQEKKQNYEKQTSPKLVSLLSDTQVLKTNTQELPKSSEFVSQKVFVKRL